MKLKCASIRISGKVQGVAFRYGVKEQADKLGLVGFTKNETDGSVIIVVEGEEKKLQKLIEWARVGTKWAEVDSVEVEWKEAPGEFKDFDIK